MADKYGRYTIIHEVEKSNGMRRALCRCDCGTERIVFVKNLKSGNSTSCGCRSQKVSRLARNYRARSARRTGYEEVLMRNNSQKAVCIRAFPASQSCHVRRVEWMSAAAAVCESPEASRAARISSGAGLRDGEPPRDLFGWPVISLSQGKLPALKVEESIVFDRANGVVGNFDIGDVQFGNASRDPVFAFGADLAGDLFNECAGFFARGFVVEGFGGDFEVFDGVHLWLQPLFPRRGGLRCATHELNYTRFPCNCKNYLHKFKEAPTPPHNGGFAVKTTATCNLFEFSTTE